MTNSDTLSATTRANRKTLLLTLAIFVLPVLVAFVLLKTGLYTTAGTSNRGQLIDPPVEFESLALTSLDGEPVVTEQFRKKWWIMFVLPVNCEAACRNSLYQMRQIQQALGPDQSRVATLIVMPHAVPAELASWLEQDFSHSIRVTANAATLDAALAAAFAGQLQPSAAGHLYLMDTMGAIFMHYPGYEDEQESILKGRDLLKDLQRVLKISRIG